MFRFEYFHLVTSARFDHEELSTAESLAPHPSLVNATYTKNIPLFGLGIGNDFGHGNETYLNVSQGFRPLRYLDIASPFSNFSSTNNPDPTKYLTYEAGVRLAKCGTLLRCERVPGQCEGPYRVRATHPDRDHQCEHR